jgi:hypothetical protein
MVTNQWRRWLRRPARPRIAPRLRLESLETRDVPSSTAFGGTLNGSSQTYNHPTADGTALSGQVTPFMAMAFRVSTDDVYTLTNSSNTFTNSDGFFALYQISFNPSNPLNNLVAANDNYGGTLGNRPQLTQELVPGTTYLLVTSGAGSGATGDFINQISSPGTGTYTLNTHSLPAVDTPTETNVNGTSATLGGTVEGDGGAAVTERGVVYSITSVNGSPTIGGTGVTKVTAGSGLGVFTANVSGLTLGATYSVRAYATNAVGTFYTSPVMTVVTDTPPSLGGMITTAQTINDNATVQPFILTTVTDPDSPPQTETATLSYTGANGTFTTLGGFTGSAGSYSMTGTAAQVQAALRGLTFVPTRNQVPAGQSVTTNFSVTVSDGVASASDSTTTVVAISVNDPPVLSNPIQDQVFTGPGLKTFTFAVNTFTDPDPGTTLVYTATLEAGGSLPSWLSFNPATRTFSGNPGVAASSPLSILVSATDNKGAGTFDVFHLSLVNVNDAPVLTPGTPTLPTIASNVTSANDAGQLVSTLIGSRVTDADGDAVGIAVSGMTNGAGGTWQYATDGTTWTNFPAATSATAPLLLNADADTRVRFLPSTNAAGTPTLTYKAWDRTAGGAEGALSSVDPAGGGGGSAFSALSETASVSVTSVAATGVASIQVGDGLGQQRSEVRSITVTFSGPVTFAGGNANAAAAFHLTRSDSQDPFPPVTLSAAVSTDVQGRTVVVLTFSGSQSEAVSGQNGATPSLADGRYQLTIYSASVTGSNNLALDGDGDGVAGGDYVSPTDTAGGGPGQLGLYRLYGDFNGDGVVNAYDYGQFRMAFGAASGSPAYKAFLDADNSGAINAFDFAQFRLRFGISVVS